MYIKKTYIHAYPCALGRWLRVRCELYVMIRRYGCMSVCIMCVNIYIYIYMYTYIYIYIKRDLSHYRCIDIYYIVEYSIVYSDYSIAYTYTQPYTFQRRQTAQHRIRVKKDTGMHRDTHELVNLSVRHVMPTSHNNANSYAKMIHISCMYIHI